MTFKLHSLAVLILFTSSMVLASLYPYPTIPIDQCRIADIGIGTEYKFVVDSLGPADEEKTHRVNTASTERPQKTLIYKGLYMSFFRDRLMMLKDTGTGLALPNGISVGSSEEDAIAAFGVPPIAMDDSRAYLAFVCVRPGEISSGILLQLLLINGVVDNIVLNKNL